MQQIALNFFHAKKEKIRPADISKHNSNRSKRIIILIILNGEGRHYIAVKHLSVLIRRVTSKHHGDFYFLNRFHSFTTENKCESHEKVCENKNSFNVIMPSEDTKILEFNQ